jgi:hypothetical protein
VIALIETVLTVAAMAIVVMIAPLVTAVVIAARWAISLGNPVNFFLALFGLLSIGVLVGHLEHLTYGDWQLPIELPAELIVMIEPTDGTDDYFNF